MLTQTPAAEQLDAADDFPGVLGMLLGVGADEGHLALAEVHRRPDGPVLRVLPVGPAPRMRDLADLDQRDELLLLRVDDGDLVALVGRDQEVALARVPA